MAQSFDEFLKGACGTLDLDWRKYRRRASRRNLHARMAELGIEDYDEYARLLQTSAGESGRFPDLIRVTVSRFFRERSCWLELADLVLPELLGDAEARGPLTAWSCGCCNGEEPYSLVMLALWRFPQTHGHPLQIMATDIDEQVLTRAEAGCYEDSALRELPEGMPRHFLIPEDNRKCVSDEVKKPVTFKRHNLMEDEPPKAMDLILCRYLPFTYYLGGRRLEAARRLWQALRPGGALMIGRKDRLGPGEMNLFEPWPGTEAVLRKRIDTG